jgi:glutamate synthase (ferredoxin)
MNSPRNQPFGLYDPATEHDACGVGFVVDIHGRKSHRIVRAGIEILINLTHRGATGCDPCTGDGAGIMTQIPDAFFRREAATLGMQLPAAGEYGVGFFFMPNDPAAREFCIAEIEQLVREEGQQLIGWRKVPTQRRRIGWIAQEVEPTMSQLFVRRGPETPPELFEWKLFVIRKRWDNIVYGWWDATRKAGKNYIFPYAPSFSSRTIVYKGLMLADQVDQFYPDLQDEDFVTSLALVHQRYSTNTWPTWDLAHPFRFIAHNGEINTLRGNLNWMRARESVFAHKDFGEDVKKIQPVCRFGASDSATLDATVELLVMTGRSLPEVMSMLVPEPWEKHESMPSDKRAYYQYQSTKMEPWDGPAAIAFTDGTCIGAVLDRNGLRPGRYWETQDGLVIMASETGVVEIAPENVKSKGRLQPGRMFYVDTAEKRIVSDDEVKAAIARKHPYESWLKDNLLHLSDLPAPKTVPPSIIDYAINKVGDGHEAYDKAEHEEAIQQAIGNGHHNGEPHHDDDGPQAALVRQQRAFGYTLEDLRIIVGPMAASGKEPIGSMGTDTPVAVLSTRPQLLYNYFKQLFAQVTNPPLDAIREEIVTSLMVNIGGEGNLLEDQAIDCSVLQLEQPILTDHDLARVRELNTKTLKPVTLPMLYRKCEGAEGLRDAIEKLRLAAAEAIHGGASILILSDRGLDEEHVPVPALLATAAVHHYLIRQQLRTRCALIVESGEPREIHHFALLFGYGASAVNPYLAFATVEQMRVQEMLETPVSAEQAQKNFVKALGAGILKVMSKMGISTLASYQGAQIFEAVGLSRAFIDEYFTWTPSRLQGIGIDGVAVECQARHDHAYPKVEVPQSLDLDVGGEYQWRRKGEQHLFNPQVVSTLQQATRLDSREKFREFCTLIDDQSKHLYTLRGLLEFKKARKPISLDEVEPATKIVKRFSTGAMSLGAISAESHEALAIAMNRIGARSNTGEGGEDPARFKPDANGDSRRSAIKQVASGRFGVTSEYLVNSDELQIKMAQGAKPGEGGQLPGHKVSREIARVRHSTPGVGLISPPPHHDIYSIEDLAQLIHDLKNANYHARISVKLVAEVGVGTVAAGVAKGKSDVILISGYDGGTGASPITSIKHAGLPWELGVAETHQVLLKNDLRGRVVVQVDGQVRTARDVAIATLLGAEEYGVSTGALVVVGCIMMRKCHLNTCPVGIATQDPELRKKFAGKPEHVVNYFFLLAEELRVIMAELGFRTIDEMVGHTECLAPRKDIDHWKASNLDLSCLLEKPNVPSDRATYHCELQDHGIEQSLDWTELLRLCEPALDRREPVKLALKIQNVNRTVGTLLASELTRRHGPQGLPEDTIHVTFRGTAGQSLLAFGTPGITFRIHGDVNDYAGKGLCGAKLIVRPPKASQFVAHENIICGNVALYGATAGELYVNGMAGERFAVRNSGANAVVEGIGDHGCEYMTGGRVVILGATGRNFAAGMSGGIAYVLDEHGTFPALVNMELVELESLDDAEEAEAVYEMIRKHVRYTDSALGRRVLENWDELREKFVKVMPVDYRRAMEDLKREELATLPTVQLEEVSHG